MTVNKVILVGNLGADPETRSTQTGTTVASLRIATNERRKDRDGNWGDHTEWHRVVCFGKTAENVVRFLSKGRQIYIEGKLRTNKWQDKDGHDRWTTEVIADTIRFLGTRDGGGGSYSDGGAGGGGRSHDQSPPAASGGGGGAGGAVPDDDIPF